MSDVRSATRREAIQALRRIRAVESPADEEGVRTVWHQGAKGTELVSWVNTQGRVVRQDFTLIEDHFSWSSRAGLKTGEVSGAPGSKAGPASGLVSPDAAIAAERVQRAAEAIASYDGDDRYVIHLRRMLELTLNGLTENGEQTVTGGSDAGRLSAAVKRRSQRPVVALVVAAGLLVGGVGVWLFIR